jgi:hypothetical protein
MLPLIVGVAGVPVTLAATSVVNRLIEGSRHGLGNLRVFQASTCAANPPGLKARFGNPAEVEPLFVSTL